MSSVKVIDQKGVAVGTVDLPAVFQASADKGGQAVHDAVVAYRNGLRAGTASTKGKGAVAGSGKKPWKQKGTGRARAGYRRSPVWKGGGVAFGPVPRSYAQRLPKKVARLAFRRALADKVRAGALTVLDALTLDAPKTKTMAALVRSLKVAAPVLFVLDKAPPAVRLAIRNLPDVAFATAAEVHTYAILQAGTVVATRAALDGLARRMGEEGEKAS